MGASDNQKATSGDIPFQHFCIMVFYHKNSSCLSKHLIQISQGLSVIIMTPHHMRNEYYVHCGLIKNVTHKINIVSEHHTLVLLITDNHWTHIDANCITIFKTFWQRLVYSIQHKSRVWKQKCLS